ncbi:hypothetical protein ACFPT7_16365 [Acidicapsa dinghuensis]|uniref:DUF4345 domain-containing protein n=1 Tax=Acidicapsa dinghuensis TaxID=2218256 RepID=A0ABW1EHV2_9BACT|nr:hypothetical protein [Acidicapsa dinghuensis]
MNIFRAFLALLAGFLTMALPTGIITTILTKQAPQWVAVKDRPRPAYLIANLAYSLVFAIAGGFVTGIVGRENPLHYALILAIVVLLLSGMSAVYQRGKQPVSYQILMIVLTPACVMLGGWLRYKSIIG